MLFSRKKRKKPFFCAKVAYNVLSDKTGSKLILTSAFVSGKALIFEAKRTFTGISAGVLYEGYGSLQFAA